MGWVGWWGWGIGACGEGEGGGTVARGFVKRAKGRANGVGLGVTYVFRMALIVVDGRGDVGVS